MSLPKLQRPRRARMLQKKLVRSLPKLNFHGFVFDGEYLTAKFPIWEISLGTAGIYLEQEQGREQVPMEVKSDEWFSRPECALVVLWQHQFQFGNCSIEGGVFVVGVDVAVLRHDYVGIDANVLKSNSIWCEEACDAEQHAAAVF